MADKYLLRVTAGPGYDTSTHVVLPVNTPESTLIKSDYCTARVKVRVQNYRGLPHGSPTTSPYFTHPDHIHDQYSISFSFTPHDNVSGAHLVFGNDFERPIRDRLPPGFSAAFRIVKWAIDPGLEGDPYADKPYLYSPLLATIGKLGIGELLPGTKADADADTKADTKAESKDAKFELPENGDEPISEGGSGSGVEVREEAGLPETIAARKKWGLVEANKASWEWERGRVYEGDFFNPYLDFNNFSLKLPGFNLPVLGSLGGEDSLRYTLKNTETDAVFFVVVFTLLLREDVEKEEAERARKGGGYHDDDDDPAATTTTTEHGDIKKNASEEQNDFKPSEDDLD